ncbi:MAG: 6,7-dimethyl-8-ribityllumazine synthase, partial [Rhodocyclales bacterium CG17_big_fil_post_rev_8_21_14_2_50_68_7]
MARYDEIDEIEPATSGEGLRLGLVMSRFNPEVGDGLLAACTEELLRLGVRPADLL